jgi:uncharacterized protein YdcH (DUF465 family)
MSVQVDPNDISIYAERQVMQYAYVDMDVILHSGYTIDDYLNHECDDWETDYDCHEVDWKLEVNGVTPNDQVKKMRDTHDAHHKKLWDEINQLKAEIVKLKEEVSERDAVIDQLHKEAELMREKLGEEEE